MRLVRVTIEYVMDDADKSLHKELADWEMGNITVQDLECDTYATPTTLANTKDMITTVRINELDSQGEVK